MGLNFAFGPIILFHLVPSLDEASKLTDVKGSDRRSQIFLQLSGCCIPAPARQGYPIRSYMHHHVGIPVLVCT